MAIYLRAVLLDRPLTQREEESLLTLVPESRRQRLLRLRKPEWRQEPLCAYGALLAILREQCGWQSLPSVAVSVNGKPFFLEFPELHFNLSHTRGAVLAGVSAAPIGVDIEKNRPVSQRAAERIFGTEHVGSFFESWVRREARAKRIGCGVGTGLEPDEPLLPGEQFRFLRLFDGYVAGLSCRDTETLQNPKTGLLSDLMRE
jgi:4'-phosphopantetheinyl transferase